MDGDDKLLEAEWLKLRQAVPLDAGGLGLRDMHQAFYAGAWSLLLLVVSTPDLEALKVLLGDLVVELEEFNRQMRAGDL